MAAVVVDSSVLISLAAGEQFHLLRDLYQTIHVPPAVWAEVSTMKSRWGVREVNAARDANWLVVQSPGDLSRVKALPIRLEEGEVEALALALELADALPIVDDGPGRRAAEALGLRYTATIGVLIRGKGEGKLTKVR